MNPERLTRDDFLENAIDTAKVKVGGSPRTNIDPDRWTPYVLGALRVVVGFLFMAHGTQKLFGIPASAPQPAVELASLMGIAGLIEATGGALVLLGLFTRLVAFVLAGEMAFAYFTQHSPHGFWPILNQGELSVLYCFIFLFLTAAGPGLWSVDGVLHRSHPRSRRHHHGRWVHQH